jgi:preprotein translocase subunit YajC
MQQYSQYFFIIAIIAVFYFLIIRPQKKRQKDQAELISSLVAGAEIMTIGGLYGTIVSIDDDRVRIEVADGSELEFAKSAIARVIPPSLDETDDADADADEQLDDPDANDDVDATLASEAPEESIGHTADEPQVAPETKPQSADV